MDLKELGIKQSELAARIGMTRVGISQAIKRGNLTKFKDSINMMRLEKELSKVIEAVDNLKKTIEEIK